MKKKYLCAMLAAGMMMSILSGCSLFASGGSGDGEGGGFAPVKLTDSYSFKDPEGLDFDSRYVVVCDKDSTIISSDTMVTYGVQQSHYVIYGKDNATIASYDFYLCDSEENAEALLQFYADVGNTVIYITEEDPTVLCNTTDPDKLAATVTMLADGGLIAGADAKSYTDFCVTSYGGRLAG